MLSLYLPVLIGVASSSVCSPERAIDALASEDYLYIGEVHGTREVPELIHQVVVRKLSRPKQGHLTVSLELPSDARQPDSDFWRGTDGRSSVAMLKLVHDLVELEKSDARLKLHFQHASVDPSSADYAAELARELNAMRKAGQVLAYGGNFHSRSSNLEGMEGKSPNMLVSPSLKAVAIWSVDGGESWMCSESTGCNAQEIEPSPEAMHGGECVRSGSQVGHDQIIFLKSFSASPPAIEK